LLVLRAGQQQGEWTLRPWRGSEALRVDRVVQDLPGPAALPEETVGGELAERALVEHVIGLVQQARHRPVDVAKAVARPCRVRDAVLVPRECGAPPARDAHQGRRIERQAARAEIQHAEVAWAVRERLGEMLELHDAAAADLAQRRHAVAPVRHAYALRRGCAHHREPRRRALEPVTCRLKRDARPAGVFAQRRGHDAAASTAALSVSHATAGRRIVAPLIFPLKPWNSIWNSTRLL